MRSSYQRSLRFALASSRRPVPHSGCVRSFSSTRSAGKDIQEAYIIAAARTPVGVFNGAFASVPAPQLGATAIRAALSRTSLPHEEISAAYIGNVLSAGMGQAPARQAIIRAGLPQSLDATTVNKVCASGLKSVALAAQQIALGLERAVIAGGMENMSRVPYLAPRGSQYPGFGNVTLSDGMISDGLWDAYNNVHMGSCAERTALTYKLPRERQDAYAVSSYTRAQAAWDAGQFADEVAPVSVPAARKGKPDTEVKEDEQYRKLKLDKVPTLKPAFALPPGLTGERTVTAANSSSFNDGAAALILTNAELARQYARDSRVLARVVSSADAALDPMDFPVAPAKAVPLALERAGLTVADISAWEINEAFACVVLANAQILGGLKDSSDGGIDKVNQRGGSIAIGHAIGSSGARILTTLLHTLKVGEYGCVGICNGGGAATALIVQRVDHV